MTTALQSGSFQRISDDEAESEMLQRRETLPN